MLTHSWLWLLHAWQIILYNRYILHDLDFPYPLSIVLMHMTFVTICCHAWKRAGWVVVPSISWSDVLWKFVPVAIFFGGSLAFANAAYLYISVAFIQMMKASTPVFVLLASFAFRLEKPTWSIAGWITIIFTGVTIASFAQVDVVVMGVVVQVRSLANKRSAPEPVCGRAPHATVLRDIPSLISALDLCEHTRLIAVTTCDACR